MNYPIRILPLPEEDGGGWLAMVEDLPGCMGDGETPEEAFADARAAMKEWMSEAHRRGMRIPEPRPVDVGELTRTASKSAA